MEREREIYWVDVETSDVDVYKCQLLEVAIAKAKFSDPFNVTPVYHRVFGIDADDPLRWPAEVREMHTKNGLIDECIDVRRKNRRPALREYLEAGAEILKMFLSGPPVPLDADYLPLLPVLAGSSVHFDRAVLAHFRLISPPFFSHRHFDVSAIKLLCESLGMPKIPKKGAHRAQADILESVEHAKQCVAWLKGSRSWML